MFLSALLLLAPHLLLGANGQDGALTTTAGSISTCCRALKQQFGANTLIPGSPSTSTYYNLAQAAMTAGCRVYPQSANDVSAILKISSQYHCPFAVRSGGHMIWSGSSNTNPDGFVLDLGTMKNISVSADKSTVSLGPALKVVEVYDYLDPLNLTVAVGRAAEVGMGGFLLGGGLTFFTSKNGFASNHVKNYQVVLADGTITNVNANSKPDLYYALKMGSTNLGIVTRFDVESLPFVPGTTCAGVHGYDISALPAISQILIDFLDQPAQSPSLFAAGAGWQPTTQAYGALHAYTHNCGPGTDQLFNWVKGEFGQIATFDDPGPSAWSGYGQIVESVKDLLFPGGHRESWQTITLKSADAQLISDIFSLTQTAFAPLHAQGITDSFTIQPFTASQLMLGQTGRGTPEASTFSASDGKLIVYLLIVEWDDPSKDNLVQQVAKPLFAKIEALAKRRGMLHPWIYLNYADSYQAVYPRSVSRSALSSMMSIRDKYDTNDFFANYWRGGYKLPLTQAALDQAEASADSDNNPDNSTTA